jgi:hypothetical protein
MSCHALAWTIAVSSTQVPMEWMSPVSSASGMNCEGGIQPSSGLFQRSRASTEVGEPSARLVCGW